MSAFFGTAGASYCAESVAFFNRLATSPPTARAQQYDILFRSLVNAGVWPLLDALWVLAAADEATARLNLVSLSHSLTAVNSPTFEADRGYTSDGATSYLTGPNLTTFGGQYVLNDAHMGVFVRGNLANDANPEMGVSTASVRVKSTSAQPNHRANDATSAAGTAVATAQGHSMWSRSSSTAYAGYKDGVLNASPSATTTSIQNAVLKICGAQNSAFSPRQVSAAHVGKSMTATQAAAMSNALTTYMQSVGAV